MTEDTFLLKAELLVSCGDQTFVLHRHVTVPRHPVPRFVVIDDGNDSGHMIDCASLSFHPFAEYINPKVGMYVGRAAHDVTATAERAKEMASNGWCCDRVEWKNVIG